jgi:hypothetical protein
VSSVSLRILGNGGPLFSPFMISELRFSPHTWQQRSVVFTIPGK